VTSRLSDWVCRSDEAIYLGEGRGRVSRSARRRAVRIAHIPERIRKALPLARSASTRRDERKAFLHAIVLHIASHIANGAGSSPQC